MRRCFVLMLLVSTLVPLSSVELFSAIVDLERLLHSEKHVAKHLKSYIAKETQRLEALTKIADSLEEHSDKALENPNKFVSNPINAFKLVRRFTSGWSSVVQDYVQSGNTEEFLRNLPNMTTLFPDEEDLTGSAIALFRLVDTYALDANEVALGNILAKNNSPPLSAYECFELGKLAHDLEDYYHTILFMNASLFVLEKEENPTISKFYVLDYMSHALYMQGNVLQAYLMTLSLLEIDPQNDRLLKNKVFFQDLLKEREVGASDELKLTRPLDEYRNSDEFYNYEKLCRGEKTKKYHDEHKLKCHLKRHHPMFYIKPLKEEEVYLEPRIVVYHDFVSRDEMKLVKQLAFPKLNRATVQNSRTGQLETASYRVSKSAWIKDVEHEKISRISQRAGALVNLTLDHVEELQVVNYGIGGHYEPHFDFARKEEVNAFDDLMGNRILTFICYMTDVEAGGSTVFPEIGVELKPQEGSCAVWHNLFRNGEGDHSTRHAACPVLVGNKWVANKWFHERGQEFIRPCSLNPNE